MIRDSFGAMYRNQTAISEAFQERTKKAEGATREVHNLIKSIQTSAASRRDREQRALEQLDSSLLDKIEDTLEDHQARVRFTVFGATVLAVAVAVAINKLV